MSVAHDRHRRDSRMLDWLDAHAMDLKILSPVTDDLATGETLMEDAQPFRAMVERLELEHATDEEQSPGEQPLPPRDHGDPR